jgi:hypothetical protein
LPLDNAPLVEQGMTHDEVDRLIDEALTISSGGMYRWTNGYMDDRHSVSVEFFSGRVVEVWLDGQRISPPEPRDEVWKELLAAQAEAACCESLLAAPLNPCSAPR